MAGVATKVRVAAPSAEQPAPPAIALDLAPLIAPYRKFGRLSLRVEGLAPRARLSKGHNNGDRSWSLFSDELEGLLYHPATAESGPRTLAVRIVRVDGGDGTTLALLDYALGAPAKAAALPELSAILKPRKLEPRPASDTRDEAEARRFALAEAETLPAQHDVQREKERARAEAEAARARSDEAERRRLREEVSKLRAALKEQDAQLAQAQEEARFGAGEALKRAHEAWARDEAERLRQARAAWERDGESKRESALARVQAAAEARRREAESEMERLKDDLAHANGILADREGDIGELQAQLERAEQAARTLSRRDGESERLTSELADTKRALAAREHDLVKAAAALEQARDQWLQETERRLAEALAAWKREEAARALAVETQIQEQAQGALLRLSDKLKHTEQELKEVRAQAEALRQRGDAEDIRRLRQDHGHLQSVLAERETEIAQLRLDSEHARERWTADARMTLQAAEQEWRTQAEEEMDERERGRTLRRNLRDALLVASLAAFGVLAWQRFDPAILNALWPDGAAAVGQSIAQPSPAAKAKPVVAPAPVKATATLLHGANLRGRPALTGDVVAALPRAAEVEELERQGNWVHIRTVTPPLREGWVYASYVQPNAAKR
ncbi:MAG: SH3 domain-containing protein [Alphaproteobacteria bacterium]|nr:SH3 domain-containing protein [Alphaproteobacteria bacterium]MBV9693905.1 SH3 domain-containing protein [Alphaproteobacteria bacterium]